MPIDIMGIAQGKPFMLFLAVPSTINRDKICIAANPLIAAGRFD
jgi:hypothetical protein